MIAANNGRDHVLRDLLKAGADVNATEAEDKTALMFAAESGSAICAFATCSRQGRPLTQPMIWAGPHLLSRPRLGTLMSFRHCSRRGKTQIRLPELRALQRALYALATGDDAEGGGAEGGRAVRCARDACGGVLDEAGRCRVCARTTCAACGEPAEDDGHTCDPANVRSREACREPVRLHPVACSKWNSLYGCKCKCQMELVKGVQRTCKVASGGNWNSLV